MSWRKLSSDDAGSCRPPTEHPEFDSFFPDNSDTTMALSNEDAALVAGILIFSLDVVSVIARFCSRWVTRAGFGWDDWTILMALLFGILPGGLQFWANSISPNGASYASNHFPDYVYTPADIEYTKIMLAVSVIYFLVTCMTKVSILLLFHRIFAMNKVFRIQIQVLLGVVVAYWISATVADCLQCRPLMWAYINPHADPRYCIDFNLFWLLMGVFESIIDLAILMLPLTVVSTLNLARKQKFGVAGVFLLGTFVLFSGVAKVILSYQKDSREPDYARAALWTTVHLYLGIICANLAPTWPLIGRLVRLSTGSWVTLSSIGRRWYGLSSGGRSSRSRDKDIKSYPQIATSEEKSRNYSSDRPIDVEIGRTEYELDMYGQDGQIPDNRVHVRTNIYQEFKSDTSLVR